jgi:hypothetical protein
MVDIPSRFLGGCKVHHIMHACQSHIIFDDIAEGVDVEMAKGPQPSQVFTRPWSLSNEFYAGSAAV